MKSYTVSVSRTMTQFMDVDVEAESEEEAKELAIEQSKADMMSWDDCGEGDDYEAHEITEAVDPSGLCVDNPMNGR